MGRDGVSGSCGGEKRTQRVYDTIWIAIGLVDPHMKRHEKGIQVLVVLAKRRGKYSGGNRDARSGCRLTTA
jgi:hypothetical protein